MVDMKEASNMAQKEVSGWSNTNSSYSTVITPKTLEELCSIVKTAKQEGKKVIARGAGLSYGDQSLNKNEIVVDMLQMNKIIDWNPEKGVLKVEPGAMYRDVLLQTMKDSWVIAVVPGTRYVTIGGALGNNVHGKNSFSKGNLGNWILDFKIVLADGETRTCSKEENEEIFSNVIGGAGLLGIVTEITLQLVKIPSPFLSVIKSTAPTIDEILEKLEKASKKNDFTIAQIDCFTKKGKLGRGTIHVGDFIEKEFKEEDVLQMRNIPKKIFGIFPRQWITTVGKYVLNDYSMRIVSSLKYYLDKITSSETPHIQDFYKFTFFLDQIPYWKKVFRNGFFEYQTLLPKEQAKGVIKELILLTHKYKMPAYLSAIKVHSKDAFPLSFSLDGYSFALDIPRNPGKKAKQDELFREMNKLVIEAGGIIYLAKDATLNPPEFREMYKNIPEFLDIKKKYDPDEVFQSDMYRRIFKNTK